jgi:nickel/cobalt exporter
VRPLAIWLSAAGLALFGAGSAFAAAMNRPFAVGGGEGGGGASGGVTGWLLNQQAQLTHRMASYIHLIAGDSSAIWGLVALGFAYGVFHAAGPGHGKAVIASYMMASDRALKRGAILALFAALLQGLVAVMLVGVAAWIFNATAARMNQIADALATASYCGIALIGAWLAVRKGRALYAAIRSFVARRQTIAGGILFAGAPWREAGGWRPSLSFRAVGTMGEPAVDDDCGHAHALDPSQLGEGFTWRGAMTTVVAAGARPCSGAILVLVFSLAQHLLWVGVVAVFAMSLGTAITTGALAFAAVFAKSIALRFASGEDSRVTLISRAFEFAAALLVLVFGLALLAGAGAAA